MDKNVVITILVVIVLALAAYLFWPSLTQAPVSGTTTSQTESDMTVCAQVVTPARNTKTGEIQEYPTPCDVPEGWEVIENDIPGLDLEVQ